MADAILIVGLVAITGVLVFSWIIADDAMSKAISVPLVTLRRDKRWRWQLAYRIPLILVPFIPFALLCSILLTMPWQSATYNNLSDAHNPALEDFEDCPDVDKVDLTISMRSLDPAQQAANAELSLCVGGQILRNLTVIGSGSRPLYSSLAANGLSASFLQSALSVSFLGSIPEVSITRTVTIKSILAQVGSDGMSNPVDLGQVSLPLFGNAVSYPLDTYSANGEWVIKLPANLEYSSSSGIGDTWTDPADVTATPDADNIAWRWGFQQGPGDIIQANRVITVVIFVLLIASLPLLLFGGLLVLLRQLMSDPDRDRFPAELLVGVGAFLLAIIPVRAVLVPSDISQTTIVDYILGTEMTVMVVSSLVILLAASGKSRKPGEVSPGMSVAAEVVTLHDRQIRRGFMEALHVLVARIAVIGKIGRLLRKAGKDKNSPS